MERVNGGNWTSSARGARIPMPTFARDFRQATLVLVRRGELHFSMESLSFVSKGAKTAVFWSFYRDCDSKRCMVSLEVLWAGCNEKVVD